MDKRDLGNIEKYDDFLGELTDIFGECITKLKPKKYAAIIVSDFRDKGKYHLFHADIAREMEERGMETKGITVLYQRHKRVFPYGYPAAFVPNIHNQFIVILQKPVR